MPKIPYLVYGIVYNSSNSASSGVSVYAKDETTGESTPSVTTNSSGQYIIDLANLNSGYTTGDFIQIIASGGVGIGKDLRFKAKCFTTQAQIEQLDVAYTAA